MDEKTDKIIENLKKVTLSEKEKAVLKLSLFEKIKRGEKGNPVPTPFSRFHFVTLYSRKYFQFVLVPVLVFMLLGGGVAFAAEKSLPGSILYPVKIYVNEPVARVFHRNTPEKKADFEVDLVDERLKEAEELSDSDKLDPVLHEKVKKQVLEQAVRAVGVEDADNHKKENDSVNKIENKVDQGNAMPENKKEDIEREKKHEEDHLDQVIERHQKIIEKLGIKADEITGKRGKK